MKFVATFGQIFTFAHVFSRWCRFLPFIFLNINLIYQACSGAVDIDYLRKILLLEPSFIRGVERKQGQWKKEAYSSKFCEGNLLE